VLIVSDVHGAFDALADVVARGEVVLVLGDLVNLIDYRTCEGIVPDVIGSDLAHELVALRGQNQFDEANRLWVERTAALGFDVREEIGRRMRREYVLMRHALEGGRVVLTHGNVDDPEMLIAHLPPTTTYVDGGVVDIDGLRVGIVGGGVPRIGSRGEVSDHEMAAKLDALGPVDILCSHVPPAIPMLTEDVIGGRSKASAPLLDYLERASPSFHYFGDVHQPRATRWQHRSTTCVNVGYFRATGRATVHG
jgi:Icc-related predicted phosphoesterase